METLISPSLLACDFLNVENELKKLEEAKADWLHLDVMDGHFVPNLTFGFDLIKSMRKKTNLFFDVHLMIDNPTKYLEQFIKAGSNLITVHFEAYSDVEQMVKDFEFIHAHNNKVGLSLKPETKVEDIEKYLPLVDVVLVMSVEPGFGGQSFDKNAVTKIEELSKYKEENKFLIQVDGGINQETGLMCKNAGCDCLVSGSYLFNGNMEELIKTLK